MSEINRTRRSSIVEALSDKLKMISHGNGYSTDLGEQVYPRMKFWDEITEFPCVCLAGNTGTTRDIIITLIDTDQGALAPLGVGEMTLQVKY